MVRRISSDYISTADAPVDRVVLAHHGAEPGVHAGSIVRDPAADGGHVSLREVVGGRTTSKLRGAGDGVPGITGDAGVSVGTVADDCSGGADAERAAISI